MVDLSSQTNICLLGADCTNTNANSKLIAIGSTCSSDSSGIKILLHWNLFNPIL